MTDKEYSSFLLEKGYYIATPANTVSFLDKLYIESFNGCEIPSENPLEFLKMYYSLKNNEIINNIDFARKFFKGLYDEVKNYDEKDVTYDLKQYKLQLIYVLERLKSIHSEGYVYRRSDVCDLKVEELNVITDSKFMNKYKQLIHTISEEFRNF